MDVVVRHWISLVADGEEEMEGWGREIQQRAKFLYVDDGLIDSTRQ